VLVLTIVAPSAMASQGYWTSSSSYVPFGLEKYHIYLYGSYPSSTGEATRIVNEHLKVCLDFSSDQKPYLCHRISPSQIPRANDSIIDAGFFVAPSGLNSSNADACVSVDYHNMYSCSGLKDFSHLDHYLFYGNMGHFIYDDVWVVHAGADYHHLKEGTPKYDECISALS
jgi:hypothetical protein